MFNFFPSNAWERLREMQERRQTGRVIVHVKDGVVQSCEIRETFRASPPYVPIALRDTSEVDSVK